MAGTSRTSSLSMWWLFKAWRVATRCMINVEVAVWLRLVKRSKSLNTNGPSHNPLSSDMPGYQAHNVAVATAWLLLIAAVICFPSPVSAAATSLRAQAWQSRSTGGASDGGCYVCAVALNTTARVLADASAAATRKAVQAGLHIPEGGRLINPGFSSSVDPPGGAGCPRPPDTARELFLNMAHVFENAFTFINSGPGNEASVWTALLMQKTSGWMKDGTQLFNLNNIHGGCVCVQCDTWFLTTRCHKL